MEFGCGSTSATLHHASHELQNLNALGVHQRCARVQLHSQHGTDIGKMRLSADNAKYTLPLQLLKLMSAIAHAKVYSTLAIADTHSKPLRESDRPTTPKSLAVRVPHTILVLAYALIRIASNERYERSYSKEYRVVCGASSLVGVFAHESALQCLWGDRQAIKNLPELVISIWNRILSICRFVMDTVSKQPISVKVMHISIADDIKKRFHAACAIRGLKMSQVVAEMIEQWLKQNETSDSQMSKVSIKP